MNENAMIRLAEKEAVRKELLGLCRAGGQAGCSRQVLTYSIAKAGHDSAEVGDELLYLTDRRLLRMEQVRNERLGISRDIFFITADGMDCLDGNGTQEQTRGIGV